MFENSMYEKGTKQSEQIDKGFIVLLSDHLCHSNPCYL